MSITEKIRDYERELLELTGIPVSLKPDFQIEEYSLEDFFRMIARRLYMPYASVISKKRTAQIIEARQIASYLAWKYIPGATYTAIARFLGQDHTSVLHNIKTIKDRIDTKDEIVVNKISDCETLILKLKNLQ